MKKALNFGDKLYREVNGTEYEYIVVSEPINYEAEQHFIVDSQDPEFPGKIIIKATEKEGVFDFHSLFACDEEDRDFHDVDPYYAYSRDLRLAKLTKAIGRREGVIKDLRKELAEQQEKLRELHNKVVILKQEMLLPQDRRMMK